jgi:hypothetical protein
MPMFSNSDIRESKEYRNKIDSDNAAKNEKSNNIYVNKTRNIVKRDPRGVITKK